MPKGEPPSRERTLRALEEAIASPAHLSARQMRDLLMQARDDLSTPSPTQADEERAKRIARESPIAYEDEPELMRRLLAAFTAVAEAARAPYTKLLSVAESLADPQDGGGCAECGGAAYHEAGCVLSAALRSVRGSR